MQSLAFFALSLAVAEGAMSVSESLEEGGQQALPTAACMAILNTHDALHNNASTTEPRGNMLRQRIQKILCRYLPSSA